MSLGSQLRILLRKHSFLFALVLAIALLVGNVIALPAFVARSSWDANFTSFAPFAILAIASTPAVLVGGGGLDLSIAPNANLVNVILISELLPHSGLSSVWVAVPIVLAASTAIGLLNGAIITLIRIPPVVVTVGMLLLLTGVVTQIAPLPTTATAHWIVSLHSGIGVVPWGLILIAIPLVIWNLLRLTPLLSTLYLVGGNQAAAYSAGVDVQTTRIVAYGLGGLFAGIGGLAVSAALLTSDTTIGTSYSLISMAAVALGGTPIGLGGRGGVLGSLIGAAVIFLLQNFLIVAHVSSDWLQLAYGSLLIVGAVAGAVAARPPNAKSASTRRSGTTAAAA